MKLDREITTEELFDRVIERLSRETTTLHILVWDTTKLNLALGVAVDVQLDALRTNIEALKKLKELLPKDV